MKNKLEKDLRKHIKEVYKERAIAIEYGMGGDVGIPDFMILPKGIQQLFFIELKKSKKDQLRISQKKMIWNLLKHGILVFTVYIEEYEINGKMKFEYIVNLLYLHEHSRKYDLHIKRSEACYDVRDAIQSILMWISY